MAPVQTPLETELLKVFKNYVEFVNGRLDADMLLADVDLEIVLSCPDFSGLYDQLPDWMKRHIEKVGAIRGREAVEWPVSYSQHN